MYLWYTYYVNIKSHNKLNHKEKEKTGNKEKLRSERETERDATNIAFCIECEHKGC